MSDVQSIHEFDFNLICEYFSQLDRQGPGSPEITNRAFDFIDGISVDSHVADIGCGTGGQTMTLARRVPGRITGIDLFPRFTELFNAAAERLGFAREDLLALANTAGIKKARARQMLDGVIEAVRRWPEFAAKAGVSDERVDQIQRHQRHEL